MSRGHVIVDPAFQDFPIPSPAIAWRARLLCKILVKIESNGGKGGFQCFSSSAALLCPAGELRILPILDLVWRAGLLSASDSVLALLLYIWQSLPCILAFAHPSSCHLPRELVSAHSRPRPESWACFWRRRGRLSLLFLAHSCVRQQLLAHHSGTQVNASLHTKRCTFFTFLGAF